jgi:putative membrane protein
MHRREHVHDHEEPSVWKGAIAGVVAGLVAAWTMNQFQAGLAKLSAESGKGQSADRDERQTEDEDDATVKAAAAISEAAFGHKLDRFEKRIAGPAVHYAIGSTVGAVYGALTELAPRSSRAWGLPLGTLVWLTVDEVCVPALGLSKGPLEYPASVHASALGAHLVYGLTTDVVRRAIRAAL